MHEHMRLVTALALGLSLSAAALAPTLSAQTQRIVYADNDPSPVTGGGNAFPFGSVGIRYQAIIPHAVFGNQSLNIVTIRDILVAGNGSDFESVFDDIEIKMGITRQVTPTTNWTTNNPNPTTVYRGPLRIRFTATPSPLWGGIGMPRSYLYLPLSSSDNLCVEVIVWAASRHASNFYYPKAGSLQRAFLYQWTSQQAAPPSTGSGGCRMAFVLNNGNIAFAGVGCQSSNSTQLTMSSNPAWPQPGNPLTLSLAGGFGPSPAFLVIGSKLTQFDLAVAGAPGCVLWNDVVLGVPTVTNASGIASFNTTVPSAILPGTIYTHWLVIDPTANAARLTTSDYATLIVGL